MMKSDQLALAQDVMRLIPKLALGLVLLSLGLFGAAIWVAGTWRRKALRACGFGLFVAGAAGLLARSAAGDVVVNALASTEAAKPAAEATWTISTTLLDEAATAALGYGSWSCRSVAGRPIRSGRRHPGACWRLTSAARPMATARWPSSSCSSSTRAHSRNPKSRARDILILLLALGMEMLRRQTARNSPTRPSKARWTAGGGACHA